MFQLQLLKKKFSVDMQAAIAKAKLCLQRAQQRQKTQADKHRREVSFTVGQQVLVNMKNMRIKKDLRTQLRVKLLPRYMGPLTATELVGPLAVRVQLPDGARIHDFFMSPSSNLSMRLMVLPPAMRFPNLLTGWMVYLPTRQTRFWHTD